MQDIEILKYPIGKYKRPESITSADLKSCIDVMETFPVKLRKETEHLSDQQLDNPYRPEGWTIRQVVHHCADSHMNSFIRFKLALTEDTPTIKTYEEDRWAELPDGKRLPIQSSLDILTGLHIRWVVLLKSFTEKEWKTPFMHPQLKRTILLEEATVLYTWHCRHHLAHITELKKRNNWK
jgi:hypothetical protein